MAPAEEDGQADTSSIRQKYDHHRRPRPLAHLAEEHGARHLLLVSLLGKAQEPRSSRTNWKASAPKSRIAACRDVSEPGQLEDLFVSLPSVPGRHPPRPAACSTTAWSSPLIPSALTASSPPEGRRRLAPARASDGLDLAAFCSLGGGDGSPARATTPRPTPTFVTRCRGPGPEGSAASRWPGAWAARGRLTPGARRPTRRAARPDRAAPRAGPGLFDRASRRGQPLPWSCRSAPPAPCARRDAVFRRVGARAATPRGTAAGLAAGRLHDARGRAPASGPGVVRAEVAVVLGHGSAERSIPIGRSRPGLRLAGGKLRNRLAAATTHPAGAELAATPAFDYPAACWPARYLLDKVGSGRGPAGAAALRPPTSRSRSSAWAAASPAGSARRRTSGTCSPAAATRSPSFPADRGWDLERLYDPDPDRPAPRYAAGRLPRTTRPTFDAAFFGISPREALAMDPQQRLLLEVAGRRSRRAGIAPGVVATAAEPASSSARCSSDYGCAQSGSASSGRGYLLHRHARQRRLRADRLHPRACEGPAITVDTACSSSLVAVHLAVQALRRGECDLALAGGVTVILPPRTVRRRSPPARRWPPTAAARRSPRPPTAPCWAEGVGVLVLERLSDAAARRPPGPRRRSAARRSTRTAPRNGLTAPNGPSQERVIRAGAGQRRARAAPTSTSSRPTAPAPRWATRSRPAPCSPPTARATARRRCWLGLGQVQHRPHPGRRRRRRGHQDGAGAASTASCPRPCTSTQPSPHIDWSAGTVELLTERDRLAGRRAAAPRRRLLVRHQRHQRPRHPRAGAGAEAGRVRAVRRCRLGHGRDDPARPDPDPALGKIRASPARPGRASDRPSAGESRPRSARRRLLARHCPNLLAHRAVALGADREQLLIALQALSRGEQSPGLVRGVARGDRRPVFLFGGYGSQWPKMARDLCLSSPAFVAHLQSCEEALAPHVDFALLENLRGEDAEWLERGEIVQATIFAVMVSLARLWQDLGVSPAAVGGTSLGEVVAAHIAGALSLEDAAHLAVGRTQVLYPLLDQGRMISVAQSAEQLAARIEPWAGKIEIAAFNGPTSTLLTGEVEAVGELLAQLEEEGVRARGLRGGNAASHSVQVEDFA